ncbi:hypothetical protein [Streptomyces sp. NPDC086766]
MTDTTGPPPTNDPGAHRPTDALSWAGPVRHHARAPAPEEK